MSSWMRRKYSFFNLEWKTLLVLDNLITQKIIKVKDKIKEYENSLSIIPSGIAWRLQPLDISINKVFKNSLRNKHVEYWIGKIYKSQRV